MHAVSQAILDVAFSKEVPPIALNLVHPRPVEWNTIIASILEALAQDNAHLDVVPFQKWFSLLETRAKTAKDEDIIAIVS